MSDQLLSRYCILEPLGEPDGPFVLVTPNYERLRSCEVTGQFLPSFNTISVGDTGTGKSLMIGMLQSVQLQTCFPHNGGGSAIDQRQRHITELV